jgi:hypothetical protein
MREFSTGLCFCFPLRARVVGTGARTSAGDGRVTKIATIKTT